NGCVCNIVWPPWMLRLANCWPDRSGDLKRPGISVWQECPPGPNFPADTCPESSIPASAARAKRIAANSQTHPVESSPNSGRQGASGEEFSLGGSAVESLGRLLDQLVHHRLAIAGSLEGGDLPVGAAAGLEDAVRVLDLAPAAEFVNDVA